jgi:uncharacterized BrkB/YihY/UPF0761 family membrane protein
MGTIIIALIVVLSALIYTFLPNEKAEKFKDFIQMVLPSKTIVKVLETLRDFKIGSRK